MAHMANISYQLGAEATGEQTEAAFSGNVAQRDMLARLRESTMMFAMQNEGVKLTEKWMLGPVLQFDNSNHRFTGDSAQAADARMTRDYRSGYELPKQA